MHNNILFKLYEDFRSFGDSRLRSHVETARFSEDLKRYGRFLWIHLYPKNLGEDIEKIIPLGTKLEEDLQLVKTRASKLGIADDPMFPLYLGIDSRGRQPSARA